MKMKTTFGTALTLRESATGGVRTFTPSMASNRFTSAQWPGPKPSRSAVRLTPTSASLCQHPGPRSASPGDVETLLKRTLFEPDSPAVVTLHLVHGDEQIHGAHPMLAACTIIRRASQSPAQDTP
jgi:hypothetical protein